MSFIRTRGEEQRKRSEIMGRLDALKGLETACRAWDVRLGREVDTEALTQLDDSTHRFLAGVQGAMGMMNLSRERLRDRLAYWDMNYGSFEEALVAVRTQEGEIAVAAASAANRATALAAAITLLASLLFVVSLGRVKARRDRDLHEEHLSAERLTLKR